MHISSPNSWGHQWLTFKHRLLEKFLERESDAGYKCWRSTSDPRLRSGNSISISLFTFTSHSMTDSTLNPKHIFKQINCVYSYTELFWVPSPNTPYTSILFPRGKPRYILHILVQAQGLQESYPFSLTSLHFALTYHTVAICLTICYSFWSWTLQGQKLS